MATHEPPQEPTDAINSIAARADSTRTGAAFDAKNAVQAPFRRAWRAAGWAVGALLAALLAALAGLWIWAGSEGSLATALRWVGAAQPLVAESVRGSLRHGGSIERLVWSQAGLRVQADGASFQWTPAALLAGTLRIDQLGAHRIVVDDRRPRGAPSTGPPASLAVPLKLQVEALRIDELRWVGPPAYALQDVAGRFDFDGQRHLLELTHARFEDGRYRARATVTAQAPVSVALALAGALGAPVPGAAAPLPLTLQATLHGPLPEMQARADVQAAPAQAGAAAPALPALPELPPATAASATAAAPPGGGAETPEAHARARITPWAAQPLPEAHARVRALDLGALWAQAPRTELTGQLDLTPLPAGGAPGWALQADLANGAPGPWDQRHLPVQSLRADITWQDEVATVRALRAQVGGGQIESTGRWSAAPGRWQLDTRIDNVNPAALHTQLAAFPLDGTAQASGHGGAIDFETRLQAQAQERPAPARANEAAAQALARDLQALRLRALQASGRWDAGLLTLNRLLISADDAELAGSARIRPATPGGSADLRLSAPGATVAVKGEAQPDRGAGSVRAEVSDATRLLAWARRLPGADRLPASAQASGRALLTGQWRGGWRDPTVQARLSVPSLDWRASSDATAIQARGVQLEASGRLAQLQLDASGRVMQGERQLELRLAATGGRTTPNAPLAASGWRATLGRLQAGVRDPALGTGSWQLASRGPVPISWSPAQGGQLELGAGELAITSPAPASQAIVAWGPARWGSGQLSTTGRITGLPLQWVERITGSKLAEAGVTGNVVFNGDWDARLGQTLRVSAQLARASGDLTIVTTDPDTGVHARVAAGLREARLTLHSEGQALDLQLAWDSAQAGSVRGQLRTDLTATRDADGGTRWAWPASAPLQGQLKAQLPQISVWSVLAPPGWRLRGALTADARVTGTRGAPQVNGTVSADGLALRSVVDGIQFEDGRLRARLDGTRLVIDEFSLRGAGAQGAGGVLRASGQAGWIDGRAQVQLDTTVDKLRASVRADRQVTVSGRLRLALEGRAISAEGRLRADRALIVLPDESTPSLGDDVIVRGRDGQVMTGKQAPAAVSAPTSAAGRQAAARAEAAAPSPLTVSANVQLDLGDDFRLRGMGIDTRLAGTLTLTADGPLTAMPRLTGTVRAVDGTFRAYGQQLVIQRGNIVFTGDASNPRLDIIALRPNYTSEQRVGAQVMGSALLPRVTLYSDPQLPDNQTLAWLLLGRPAPSSGAEAAMLQSAALALLGGREGRSLAARFGLDELSVSGGETGALAGTSVTLGKRLSDRLYAAYEHSLSGAGGTLLIFYELSRRWTLRGQAGVNPAVDLIYRLSFD